MDSSLENAIKFISGELKLDPGINKAKLIEEASRKFDLTPMQEEYLVNKYVMGM